MAADENEEFGTYLDAPDEMRLGVDERAQQVVQPRVEILSEH